MSYDAALRLLTTASCDPEERRNFLDSRASARQDRLSPTENDLLRIRSLADASDVAGEALATVFLKLKAMDTHAEPEIYNRLLESLNEARRTLAQAAAERQRQHREVARAEQECQDLARALKWVALAIILVVLLLLEHADPSDEDS